jgi:hypothetical protein
VLSAEPPLKAEVRSQIDERRKKADAALTQAAARLEDDKSPAVQALLREAKVCCATRATARERSEWSRGIQASWPRLSHGLRKSI